MRIDDVIRRGFVVIVCFLIGAAAYFQASGLMSLAEMAILGDGAGEASRGPGSALDPRSLAGKPGAKSSRDTSAAAILARNPFDSVTGPLSGERQRPPEVPSGEGDGDAACEGVRVVLISSSEDPSWSFAAIAEGTQRPILRRLGDVVAGYSVDAIGSDRVRFASGVRSCLAVLGERLTSGKPGGSSQGALPDTGSSRPGGGASLPPEIGSGIRRVGEREIEVDRRVIASVMEKQGEIFKGVRVMPQVDGSGKPTGVRLSGVRAGSLLGALGIQNGDELRSINGLEIADPKSALGAYSRLLKEDNLVVSVLRGGQPMNIDVRIR
jgi:general secretion pathway protein C